MKRIVIMVTCAVFALSGCGAVDMDDTGMKQQASYNDRHGYIACTNRTEDKYAHMVAEAVYDAVNKENTDTLYGMFSEKAKEDSLLLEDLKHLADSLPSFDEYEGVAVVNESYERGTNTRLIQILMEMKKKEQENGKLNILFFTENDEDKSAEGIYLMEYARDNIRKDNGFSWREKDSQAGVYIDTEETNR